MGNLSRDIPSEQRAFFKVFERIAYRHQYSEVFDDYLTMLINWFANGEQQEMRDRAMKKYPEEEKKLFNEMYEAHVHLFHEQIITKGYKWYDPLGDFYQTISSNYKASAMGQFFTPACMCDMMAEMLIDKNKTFQMISDPCVGSGRMLLAAHALQPMNYYWAIDIDPMCAKMAAINMCMHNACGLVTQGDTLRLEYRTSYSIERVQVGENYLPYLKVLDNEKANEFLTGIQELCRIMNGRPRETNSKPIKEIEKISVTTEQLNLFT